jgi:hypothetical protein
MDQATAPRSPYGRRFSMFVAYTEVRFNSMISASPVAS